MLQKPTHFLTRRTTVMECDRYSVIGPNLAGPDFSLEQVIERVENSPRTQTIAVVDARSRLLGIIPVSQIIDDIFLEVCPEEFLGDINDLEAAEDYALKTRLSQAHSAREMMLPPVYVYQDDTIVQAFRKMHHSGLRGIPIVERDLTVIGYLDWFEIIAAWLRSNPHHHSPAGEQ